MCNSSVLVKIPDFLLRPDIHYGHGTAHPEWGHNADGEPCFRIDACIAPALQALWDAGVRTIGSCCGHGSGHGVISLETDPTPATPAPPPAPPQSHDPAGRDY